MMTNILFIEDDLVDQMAFRRYVKTEKLPYAYTIVSTVEAALSQIEESSFDVILSDYNLKDGTAFDFLGQVNGNKIPLIFMTGMGAEEIAVRALKNGAQDYLVKARDNSHLDLIPQAIEKVIRQKQSDDIEHLTQYERSVAGVFQVSLKGAILEANETFASMGGFSSAEAMFRDEVWCHHFQAIFLPILEELSLQDGYLTNYAFSYDNVDGQLVHAIANISLVSREGGGNDVIKASLADITQLKLEEEARLRKEQEVSQLQEALQLREALSSMIVHDLRNPLAVIGLSAQMITAFTEDKKIHDLVERVMRRAETLEGLIDDMLTVARMDSGSLALEPSQSDIIELARDVVRNSSLIAERSGIQLVYKGQDEPLITTFDRKLVRRLFDNLISNGIKYAPAGTAVMLEVEDPSPKSRYITFHLRDQGAGIKPDEREKIFERFQTGSVKSKRGKQIGLGLPFCKMVVEAHNGTISVSDNDPQGACFTVSLPLDQG